MTINQFPRLLARARPSTLRLQEVYPYIVEIAGLSRVRPGDAPTGTITVAVPYDGRDYFDRRAIGDVRAAVQNAGDAPLLARIGYLAILDYTRTDLGAEADLSLRDNVVPVDVPVHGGDLQSLDDLGDDRHSAELSLAYEPQRPAVTPLRLTVKVSDELAPAPEVVAVSEEGDPGPEKAPDLVAHREAHRTGFTAGAAIRLDAHLLLPQPCDELPYLTRLAFDWPTVASYRRVRLTVAGAPWPMRFDPESGWLVAGGLALRGPYEEENGELVRYETPPLTLHVGEAAELLAQDRLTGMVEIHVAEALSGLRLRYFDTDGRETELPTAASSVLRAQMSIDLPDSFAHRVYAPAQHLYFAGVALDETRLDEISLLLQELDFSVARPRWLDAPPGRARIVISASRPEGPGQYRLWVRVEGDHFTPWRGERVENGDYRAGGPLQGDTIIHLQGELAEDPRRAVHVLNDIHQHLRARFDHGGP